MQLLPLWLASSAITSLTVAACLVRTASAHGRYTMDCPGAIQTFHTRPTPRIGGLSIYAALLLMAALGGGGDAQDMLVTLLVAGLPALAIGLFEDVTHSAGIGPRLLATLLSGVVASLLTGVTLRHVDIPVVDAALALSPLALLLTAVAVAGVANAFNIIDGFHGLASGTAMICATCLGGVAAAVGDMPLAFAAAVLTAALAGFWLVNFPWGKLFLGDGGAYFVGLAIAWLAVLLPTRNPTVSPWASLLICGYPVTEALYSIARRRLSHARPTQADRGHLHSLIATCVVQRRLRRVDPTLQNAAVSVLMWICAAIPAFVGVTFYSRTSWLAPGAICCVLLYHWLYRQLARP